MKKHLFLAALLVFTIACQSDQSSKDSKEGYDIYGNKVMMDDLPLPDLSAIPSDTLENIMNQLIKIELEILGKTTTETIEEKDDMMAFMSFVINESPEMSRKCSLKGFCVMTLEDGSKYHVDLFPDDNCAYFIFYRRSKAAFATKISKEGIEFILSRLEQK